jgi:hypothetical protein
MRKYLKDHHFDIGMKTTKNQIGNKLNLTYDAVTRINSEMKKELDTSASMERVIPNKVKIDPIPEAQLTKMQQKSIEKDQRSTHFKIVLKVVGIAFFWSLALAS